MWYELESHCYPPGIHTSGCRFSISAPHRGRLVSRDPASAFQHHVSMWYNNGKMNHWLEAHIHTLNPLLTPFGSRRACKVLKSESGLRGDWSYWPQKWGLHRRSNKYRLLRHWKQTCCRFSILSQVVLFVFPPLLEPAGMPRSVFTSFRQFQWGSGSHLTGFYATLLA